MLDGNGVCMRHSLNSLKGGYIMDYVGDYHRGYQGGVLELRLWLI